MPNSHSEQSADRENIFIENDEEIPSIITRMKSTKASKIALIVPRGSAVLQSLVNLKLLKKQAKDLNKQMSLVTTDSIGRNLASQAGLEVYENIHSAKPILEPHKKPLSTDEVIKIDETTPESPKIPVHHFQDSPKAESEISADQRDKKAPLSASSDQPLTVKDAPKDETDSFRTPRPKNEITKLGRFSSMKISLKPKIRIGKNKLIIGAVLTILTLVLLYFFIPRAVITFMVKGENFEDNVKLEVNTSAKTVSLAERKIPGHLVEVEKQAEQKYPASGTKNVGEKASGQVTFYNSWSTEAQTIPAGTIITRDDKQFLTSADVTVPGATLSLSEGRIVTKAGTKAARVEAKEAGEKYNLSAGDFKIAGFGSDKQKKFYAKNSETFSGGSTRKVSVVSAEDIEKASQELRSKLSQEILAELEKNNPGKIVLDDATEYTISSQQTSASENEEAKEFTLTLRLKGQAIIFEKETFQKAFVDLIKLELPAGKDLHLNTDDQITTSVKEKDIEEGKLIVEGSIKTQIAPQLDQAKLKKQVYGKKAAQAKDLLESQPNIEEVKIDIFPQWLPYRIPYFNFAVKSKIEYK